jgi:hypothetical protein
VLQHATDKAFKKWQQTNQLTSADEVTEKVPICLFLSSSLCAALSLSLSALDLELGSGSGRNDDTTTLSMPLV